VEERGREGKILRKGKRGGERERESREREEREKNGINRQREMAWRAGSG
jgi:hypothetical protein